jgi:hypothetical protein
MFGGGPCDSREEGLVVDILAEGLRALYSPLEGRVVAQASWVFIPSGR